MNYLIRNLHYLIRNLATAHEQGAGAVRCVADFEGEAGGLGGAHELGAFVGNWEGIELRIYDSLFQIVELMINKNCTIYSS